MKVTILSHTPEPEKIVAAAARLCYSKISATKIMEDFSSEKAQSFIKKLMVMGHMSPTEHVSFTFAIDGVSRTLLAQITRHRIGSYSVQSLRYNNPFDKEILSEKPKNHLDIKNISYLEGYTLSKKRLNNHNPYQLLINKLQIKGKAPDSMKDLHKSSYLRGVFDGVGLLSDDNKFAIAFTQELKSVLNSFHINITQKGNKLLIENEQALIFGQYIYDGLDFASPFYDELKLLALCKKSEQLKDKILAMMAKFVDTKYYAMIPKSIFKSPEAVLTYIKALEACKKSYINLVKMGINQEDARYILPHGTQTRMVVTMNVRSLYNFFNLRCCNRAQTEIRQLANLMLAEVKKVAPGLFEKAGAPCEQLGYCPEGDFGCGKYPPSELS